MGFHRLEDRLHLHARINKDIATGFDPGRFFIEAKNVGIALLQRCATISLEAGSMSDKRVGNGLCAVPHCKTFAFMIH